MLPNANTVVYRIIVMSFSSQYLAWLSAVGVFFCWSIWQWPYVYSDLVRVILVSVVLLMALLCWLIHWQYRTQNWVLHLTDGGLCQGHPNWQSPVLIASGSFALGGIIHLRLRCQMVSRHYYLTLYKDQVSDADFRRLCRILRYRDDT